MLGKLVKDEMKSYRFSFGIMFLAGLIFTIIMKVMCMLPYNVNIKDFVQIMGGYAYYYIIMLIVAAAQILVVIRFYQTMVGDRGYLTFTLPVKTSTHIWAKLIGGSIWRIIASVVTMLLLAIFFVGDYWGEMQRMFSDFSIIFQEIAECFELKYVITIVLAVLASLVWFFVPVLLIYMCIAVGQLFGKWRILASIACYFLIIIVLYILMIIGMVGMSFMGVAVFDNIQIENINGFAFMNGLFLVVFLIGVGVFALLFGITNWIFKKHLNLE